MRKIIYILLFFNFCVLQAQELKMYLDSNKAQIGDVREILIEAHLNDEVFDWFVIKDTLRKNISIISESDLDTSADDRGFVIRQTLQIMPFDTGFFVLPPFKINFKDSLIESNAELLEVVYPKVNMDADIQDIKANVDAPFVFAEIQKVFWWTLAVLVLLIVLIYAIWKWLKLKKNKVEEVKEVYVDPYEWHQKALEALEAKAYWQKGKVKEHHSELSLILRSLLQEIYRFPCKEATTSEIMNQLTLMENNNELTKEIKAVLQFADLAKYAKATGIEQQHVKGIELCKELLKKIKKEEEQIDE